VPYSAAVVQTLGSVLRDVSEGFPVTGWKEVCRKRDNGAMIHREAHVDRTSRKRGRETRGKQRCLGFPSSRRERSVY